MSNINYETANIDDLFNELSETKKELGVFLKSLEIIYQETKEKVKGDEEAEILMRSYDDDDLSVTKEDAVSTIKIIDNLLKDKIVRESHIKQLKNIADGIDRRKRLGDFKEDWLSRVNKEHKQDYNDLYVNFCEMEKWIYDCNNIANRLNDYIGEENPLMKKMSKEKNGKKIINIDFPEEVKWENVKIKIKDNLKYIQIYYKKKFIKEISYEEIGFNANKKESKEDRQWALLLILSKLNNTEVNNKITPDELSRMLTNYTKKQINKENIHQIKKKLSEKLKQIFKTEEDPFFDYKEKGFYKTKFELIPETELRGDGEIWRRSTGYNDNIGGEFDDPYDKD